MHPSLKSFFRKSLLILLQLLRGNGLHWFPIAPTLKQYTPSLFSYDIKAAFNVALLTIPQGMAYAAIANLPIYYGIVCSAGASIIAPLFSSSRHTILGPTNATAFMVSSFFLFSQGLTQPAVAYMPLLVLMVGTLLFLGALFKIADLLQYVSQSVLIGYITGAALLILVNQSKHVLGIALPMSQGEIAGTFFEIIAKICHLHTSYQWQPFLLGSSTLALYLFLQKKCPLLPNFAITLAISSLCALALRSSFLAFSHLETFKGFTLQDLQPTLPHLNTHDIGLLGLGAFAIAFLAALENTVMSKSLASRAGDRPDMNQDMLSLGIANIASSFIAPMPASSSLTRSALNYDSHAKTRLASIFSGILALGGIFFLLRFPLVQNIPKASLAALVMGIALSLINWKNIRICLLSTSDDAIVVVTTCSATLFTRLDYAIFIGVILSLMLFLRKVSKPHLVEYDLSDEGTLRELEHKDARSHPAISIVHVEGELFFGAADLFRTQVQRTMADSNLKVIILRLKNARHLDATSVLALQDLIKHTRRQGCFVLISGATRDVYKVLKKSGVLETIQEGCNRKKGETNLFMNFRANPNLSTRDALARAQELLGTKNADIKIYFDKNK